MRNLLCFDWFLYARDFGHDKIVVSSIPHKTIETQAFSQHFPAILFII